MLKTVLTILGLNILASFAFAEGGTNLGSKPALIEGKPFMVKLLNDDRRDMFFGDYYLVSLENLVVLEGIYEKKSIKVKVSALQEHLISDADRIVVLVDMNLKQKGDIYHGIYWSAPKRTVCLPRGLALDYESDPDFYLVDEKNKAICTFIE